VLSVAAGLVVPCPAALETGLPPDRFIRTTRPPAHP
jgi:hypothetical protein